MQLTGECQTNCGALQSEGADQPPDPLGPGDQEVGHGQQQETHHAEAVGRHDVQEKMGEKGGHENAASPSGEQAGDQRVGRMRQVLKASDRWSRDGQGDALRGKELH